MTEGQYIYAIIETDQDLDLDLKGIGDENSKVHTVREGHVGAVISASPVSEYPVTRANTMAHQKVMEEVMKQFPMLPVRFGTVAEGTDQIMEKLLKERHQELKETLSYMRDKAELGLKVMWKDMPSVFQEVAAGNADIIRLRDRLTKRRGAVQRDQVRLGEMVKTALEARKEQEQKALLDPLDGLWVDRKTGQPFGDQMIVNAAFLVEKQKESVFDSAVEKLAARHDGAMVFKYVGPIPPCNFVEIVVKW
jgi:hypothetical protein